MTYNVDDDPVMNYIMDADASGNVRGRPQFPSMTFAEAKAMQDVLEAEWKAASRAFDIFSADELGLTPDDVKASPEWKRVRREYDKAFNELRNFNSWFTKTFKRELRDERRLREKQMSARRITDSNVSGSRRSTVSHIGRKWNSPQGTAEVIGETVVNNEPRLVIQRENMKFSELIRPEEIDKIVTFDEKSLAQRQSRVAHQEEEERILRSQQAELEDIDGFADDKSPMAKQRIINALNKKVMRGGKLVSRKDIIREMVQDGAVVEAAKREKEGRRLVQPDGSYLGEDQITKTGIDYAEYLMRYNKSASVSGRKSSVNKWTKFEDPITKTTRYYFGEYRPLTNPEGKGIEVVTEQVEHGYRGAPKKTQHTIVISFGPYGESVYDETLPFNTNISQAKKRAIQVAEELNKTENAGFDIGVVTEDVKYPKDRWASLRPETRVFVEWLNEDVDLNIRNINNLSTIGEDLESGNASSEFKVLMGGSRAADIRDYFMAQGYQKDFDNIGTYDDLLTFLQERMND